MKKNYVLFYVLIAFGMFVSNSNAQVRVACIGNSITAGYGLPNSSYQAYPAQLGALLGTGFSVNNYGESGKTMSQASVNTYWGTNGYNNAVAFDPQIVIINLGTNDADPVRWNVYGADFDDDYKAMIDVFRQNGKNPIIFVCRTSPKFANDAQSTIIKDEVIPIINQVSTDKGTYIIDFYNNLLTAGSSFPDGVHPNFDGSALMAQIAYNAIKNANLIEPHVSVNGAVEDKNEVIVNAADNVILDPLPADGSWNWTGPNGFTAATRQVTLNNIAQNNGGFYVATYTNVAGLKSMQCFSVSIAGCTADPIISYNNSGPGWTESTDISIASGGNLQFGPQPTVGGWSWTGPNGFILIGREFRLNNIKTKHAGDYVVTYTNLSGCKSTTTFKVDVTGVDACNLVITPNIHVNNQAWQNNTASASVVSEDVIQFGPGANANNGSWSWVGPNGFTFTGREFTLNNASISNAGTYTTTYTLDDCDVSLDFILTVDGNDGTLGLEDIDIDYSKINMYPNPSKGILNINLHEKRYQSLNIFNSTGVLVYSKELNNESKLEINVGDVLKAGIYMISLQSNDSISTKKLIIK